MSKTVVECRSVVLLQGFEAAIRFMGDATYVQRLPGCLFIEYDDDCSDMTYTLTRQGLEVKHQGVTL